MKRIEVAAGLVLDEHMYAAVIDALHRYAPEHTAGLSWERFVARTSWCLVPDVNRPQLPFYKAELDVYNEPGWLRKLRLNVWTAPDLRRDGTPMPHNHPWAFESHVLMGGYTEDRYEVTSEQHAAGGSAVGAGVEAATRQHVAGDLNQIAKATFHEVTDILVPGRTVTLMDCGPSTSGDWGYLDPDTGTFTPNTPDPLFLQLLRDRNPHLRFG
ncbi:hypothetical protein [Flindersiella endophytica]